MSSPAGARVIGDDLAPKFALEVNGIRLGDDILSLVQSIEYEDTTDMIPALQVTVDNPGFRLNVSAAEAAEKAREMGFPYDFVSHTVFQPGNEVKLLMGYGDHADTPIGRGIIMRHMPTFPRDGMASFTFKALTAAQFMMGLQGPITGVRERIVRPAEPLKREKPQFIRWSKGARVETKTFQGKRFVNMKHSDIVRDIAEKYGFKRDIEETERPDKLLQKRGMQDYSLCQMLANINSKLFWVDYDEKGEFEGGDGKGKPGWVLHWTSALDHRIGAFPQLIFDYAAGDETSLLEFHPEYAITDMTAKFTIAAIGEDGEVISLEEIEEFAGARSEMIFRKSGGRMSQAKSMASSSRASPQERRRSRGLTQFAGRMAVNLYGMKREEMRGSKAAELASASGNVTIKQLKKIREAKVRGKMDQLIERTWPTATEFQIIIGNMAFPIQVGEGHFKSPKQLIEEMLRIVYCYRDTYVQATGTVVGCEKLRAHQVHMIRGISTRLDGAWYFTRVVHKFGKQTGYECDFSARKIVDNLPLE